MAYICDPCHEKSGCQFVHLSGSTGPCETCGGRASCHECLGERVELAPVTVEEIRSNLLSHLNELARMVGSCGRGLSPLLLRDLECAKHMCRLAGVSELEISKVDRFVGFKSPALDVDGLVVPKNNPFTGNR